MWAIMLCEEPRQMGPNKYFSETTFTVCNSLRLVLFFLSFQTLSHAQDSTSKSSSLDSVIILSYLNLNIVRQLPAIQGTYIFSGKKTEVIDLAQIPADVTNKTGRQVFSKIPGVFVYDMDGTGNQFNVATRGLDPHRGWEFNIRKDGIITNSDM